MPEDKHVNPGAGEDYDNTTASDSGLSGPRQKPRDRSPNAQYQTGPGENNNRTDAAAPGGPVQIKPKKTDDAQDPPDPAPGRGKAGIGGAVLE
jgi:hypothetical protein